MVDLQEAEFVSWNGTLRGVAGQDVCRCVERVHCLAVEHHVHAGQGQLENVVVGLDVAKVDEATDARSSVTVVCHCRPKKSVSDKAASTTQTLSLFLRQQEEDGPAEISYSRVLCGTRVTRCRWSCKGIPKDAEGAVYK